MDFTIAVRTTAGVRTIDKRGLTLRQAAAFVATELPREDSSLMLAGPGPKAFHTRAGIFRPDIAGRLLRKPRGVPAILSTCMPGGSESARSRFGRAT